MSQVSPRPRLATIAAWAMSVVLGLQFGAFLGVVPSQAASPTGTVKFAASGDFGATNQTAAVLTGISTSGADFALALGDLSYGTPGSEQTWCDFVVNRVGAGYPFELVAGNHDAGANGNINDFGACLPNQLPGLVGTYGRQYFVDYPQSSPLVRLIMISPNMSFNGAAPWDYSQGSARYNWTAAAIDGAKAASIPWTVVGMHYPCVSLGVYGCVAGPDITNLMLTKRVDLVLNGHEHMYQRTKQLATGAGCSQLAVGAYQPACVVDSDAQLTKGVGTVFVTSGLGGVEQRTVNNSDPEFGYFAAASGSNQSPAFGYLQVTATSSQLDAGFVATSGSFTDTFGIGAAGPNQPPVAVARGICSGLSCSFSSAGSTDPDGTIRSYGWDFGDGSTATGAAPQHSYAVAGSYSVRLTVTDDGGATATTTTTVAATTSSNLIAVDAFDRTLSGTWGNANTGGAWTVTGSVTNVAVGGGVGTIRTAAGSGPTATLNSVSAADVDLTVQVGYDKAGTGGGIYSSVLARRTGSADYRAKLRLTSTGSTLFLARSLSGVETVLTTQNLTGLVYASGDGLNVRFQVQGAGPTTLRAKVWKVGAAEPSTWQTTTTDGTAGLQSAGAVGINTYLSSSATNSPVTAAVADLRVSSLP
jgi:PKD repeat protein